jgi:hypothetical protein
MPRLKNVDSFYSQCSHIHDDFLKTKGYEYHSNLLKRVVSNEMFANPVNDIPLRQIERLIEHLVDNVKQIKLQFAFAYDKNSKNIN